MKTIRVNPETKEKFDRISNGLKFKHNENYTQDDIVQILCEYAEERQEILRNE